jgi:hypothetical protein
MWFSGSIAGVTSETNMKSSLVIPLLAVALAGEQPAVR